MRVLVLSVLAFVVASPLVNAQTFPDKSIRVVVTAPAASAPDIAMRLIADKLDAGFGQRIVVENRPGAGGIIAVTAVRQAPADGYTLGFLHAAVAIITPFTFKAANYEIDRDFEIVGTVAYSPMLFVANNQAPAKDLAEAVAHAKSRPNTVALGNPSLKSVPHLTGELLAQRTGGLFQQVPFSATTQGLQALMNGDIPYYVDGTTPLLPLVRSGKIRAIGLAADSVLPGLEGLPLAKDSVPGIVVTGWFLVFAPKGTPAPVVQRLNAELNKALVTPDVTQRFRDLGTYAMPRSVADSRAFVKAETERFAKVIKEAGIQAE
jgi:tripartite-type tricarboxylate transporter receptor subunit TctC